MTRCRTTFLVLVPFSWVFSMLLFSFLTLLRIAVLTIPCRPVRLPALFFFVLYSILFYSISAERA